MKRSQSRRVATRAALALALALTGAATLAQDGAGPPLAQPWPARVSYVVDGDSLWVRPDGGGARVRLRIDGIDAPEICQRWGPEARDALRALALNQPVRVTVHARDRWGRAIATVVRLAGEVSLAEQMVARGLAWSDGYGWRPGKYARAEDEARGAGRGLFADSEPQPPADFRRQHGPCDGRPSPAR